MVSNCFRCANGHQWQDVSLTGVCPVCGAEAIETIGNGLAGAGSTGNGQVLVGGAISAAASAAKFGRYQVVGELGRGGMGIVYRALDPVQKCEVALKTLPHVDPVLLSRFKREFRLLAEVDHPNVVKLFELTSDGETWFFTMELAEGVDLLDYLTADDPQNQVENGPESLLTKTFGPHQWNEERQRKISEGFLQLAQAADALHDAGIVHRDIKPSNVIVSPEGRVLLLDFGLAAVTDAGGSHASLHQMLLGTAAYMSPEQAACDPVTPASDWYAVGVMLYQVLTGQLPFSGKMGDILFRKQNEDPVPPKKISPHVPEAWNNWCLKLMHRQPAARPAGRDILQWLSGDRDEPVRETARLPEIALVGREQHFATLRRAWQAVQSGDAKCLFFEGRSGTGKTALVDAFLEQAAREGGIVLRGRCYEMESVPFKAIDSFVDSLVVYLSRLPLADAAALMPRDIHTLVRLFPVLGQVEAVANMPQRQIDLADQKEMNRLAIGALREILTRISDRHPLAIFVDDLQWGDEDSALLLSDLLQPPDTPAMLFLGTYRREDRDTSPFLKSFRKIQLQRESVIAAEHVAVEPLEQADAVRLALTQLQRDDEAARRSAEAIARESGGNAFFLTELVKQFQMEGDCAAEPHDSVALADMIWSRVSRLPDDSQRLLAVVSLAGQPLRLERALQIAEVTRSAINALRAGHLIRLVGPTSEAKIETYHDRVRESVVQFLDEAVKQQFHNRIGEYYARCASLGADEILRRLCTVGGDPARRDDEQVHAESAWYDAAFHFDAAGRPDLAFPYAYAAAEKSRQQYSLEVAEQQYRIAQRGMTEADDAARYRVAEGLGEVLMLRGRYPQAAVSFEAAKTLATSDFRRAQIEGKLGVLAFKQGDDKAAANSIVQALRSLGYRVPSHTAVFVFVLVWELLVQTMHSMFPKPFLARRDQNGAEKELLAVRLYIDLSYAYFFDRLIPTFWAHMRAFNLVEKFPPTAELSRVWASHGPAMALIPWLQRGEIYVKKSLKLRREFGDVCAQGQSLHYLGVILFTWAKFDECIDACDEAVKLLEKTGDFWERNMAWWQGTNAIFRKGDLPRATSEARRLYEACLEMGDDKVSRFAVEVWSRASGGRVPADVVQREMQKGRNDVWATALALLAEAMRRIRLDDLDEAMRVLTQGFGMCRHTGMNAWVGPILPWLATTHRLQWERSPSLVPHRRRQLRKKASRAARRALKVARKFQTDLPHALREAGLIAAIEGRGRRARRYLDDSLVVAERQGATFERAQTLFARGVLGKQLGWPGAQEDEELGRRILTEIGGSFAVKQLAGIRH